MPIYLFECEVCGFETELVRGIDASTPVCCGKPMVKKPTSPAIISVWSKEGYPIRSNDYKTGYSKEYLKSIETQ